MTEQQAKYLTTGAYIYVIREHQDGEPFVSQREFLEFSPSDTDSLSVKHCDMELRGIQAYAEPEDVFETATEAEESTRFAVAWTKWVERLEYRAKSAQCNLEVAKDRLEQLKQIAPL
jgi:hypothetical protein